MNWEAIRRHRGMAAAAGFWIVWHGFLYTHGLFFSTSSKSPLPSFDLWQLLAPSLLREHPFQSLWNLHMQPPLLNAIAAAALATPAPSRILWFLFLTIGFAASLILYRLLCERKFPYPCFWTILYIVWPHTWMYQNWFFYTFLVRCLLIAFLYAYFRRNVFLQCLIASLLPLLRSTFLLPISIVYICFLCRKEGRWTYSLLLFLPLAFFVKNIVLFGVPSFSSWMGMNLAAGLHFDERELAEIERLNKLFMKKNSDCLDEEGNYISILSITPFSSLDNYQNYIAPRKTGVPCLDEIDSPPDGVLLHHGKVNYNHIHYVDLSKRYFSETLAWMKKRPFDILSQKFFSLRWGLTITPASHIFVRNWERGGIIDRLIGSFESYTSFSMNNSNLRYSYLFIGMYAAGIAVLIVQRRKSPALLVFLLAPLALLSIDGYEASRTMMEFEGVLYPSILIAAKITYKGFQSAIAEFLREENP
ncbi:MAG: hypothetical protein AB1656_11500 [Candidatus Omnitrophota bacterium]